MHGLSRERRATGFAMEAQRLVNSKQKQ